MNEINLSIGQLTELCRSGDINFRFSGRSTAMEGIRGHQKVQRSRGAAYLAEYPVAQTICFPGAAVQVSGRVDGIAYDAARQCFVVEEIKTVRVDLEQIPVGVLDGYWLQATLYAALLLQESEHETILVRLVLYHLDLAQETRLERSLTRAAVTAVYAETLLRLQDVLEKRRAWQAQRQASLAHLDFPYSEYRPGQRDMAVAVYRSAAAGGQLVMQAPTGIGKTMGTIYPAVRTFASGTIDRVFYLSARTSTQVLARQAMDDLAAGGAQIRCVTLTAKEKVCLTPGAPCHPDHCQYARGYYDRVDASLDEMLSTSLLYDRQAIEDAALKYQLCPFELSLDLSSRCDVIIADYNYVFDPVVYLRRFFDSSGSRSIGLIDEAHNLVDRGRAMFSARVDRADYLAIGRAARGQSPFIARLSQNVSRALLALRKQHQDRYEQQQYIAASERPEKVLQAMQKFCDGAEAELRLEGRAGDTWHDELLSLYFDTLRFLRTAEEFGSDYRVLVTPAGRQEQLTLFCVDPSRQLRAGFQRLHAAICFSATMQPRSYFEQMLGLDQQADWYRLATPFNADHFSVHSAEFIDTSFRGRNDSADALVKLIGDTVQVRNGNYLVFFPSYNYLERVFSLFEQAYPQLETVVQQRNMDEAAREAFIRRFDGDAVCGFAVMGGLFSEGVDLKGHRLIGAIVVGVGLPQVGVERNLISEYFPESGFEFAYQYPGLIKVLQTAGRVIRDEEDRGILCLVDRRYREPRYADRLPEEWCCQPSGSHEELIAHLSSFWQSSEADLAGNALQVDTG